MGFFDKIFGGLTKTRRNLEELEEIFQSYKPDNDDFYDELEELLVTSARRPRRRSYRGSRR